MVEVYNRYLGGYLPNVPARSSVHRKDELKNIYKNIRHVNQQSPLALVRLSDDRQAYALDVKEMSMELSAATDDALSEDLEMNDREQAIEQTVDVFNRLLKRSDEYGQANGKPSRPGGELRNLVKEFSDELKAGGFEIQEDYSLTAPESLVKDNIPEQFLTSLYYKSQSMSMNPMEYVEKKVFSYAFLNKQNQPSTYQETIYSGMLFNSYC